MLETLNSDFSTEKTPEVLVFGHFWFGRNPMEAERDEP